MSLDGTGLTNLTNSPGVADVDPAWDPGGDLIVHASGPAPGLPDSSIELGPGDGEAAWDRPIILRPAAAGGGSPWRAGAARIASAALPIRGQGGSRGISAFGGLGDDLLVGGALNDVLDGGPAGTRCAAAGSRHLPGERRRARRGRGRPRARFGPVRSDRSGSPASSGAGRPRQS